MENGMAWFADLSECTYFGEACGKHLRAVGWLEQGRPYSKASIGSRFRTLIDRSFLTKLSELLENPWEPDHFCGFHTCDLCSEADIWSVDANGHRIGSADANGYRNLFVPGQDTIYVCPAMILHYIRKHGYAPPVEFTRAVVKCPPMGSRAYFDALKAQGGESLIDGTCMEGWGTPAY